MSIMIRIQILSDDTTNKLEINRKRQYYFEKKCEKKTKISYFQRTSSSNQHKHKKIQYKRKLKIKLVIEIILIEETKEK